MRGYNSTIIRKQKFCKSCGKPCYIFSKGRCEQCSKVESVLKRSEASESGHIDQEDLKSLLSDADAIFSQYIRLKYADDNGWVKCYTCPTVLFWKEIENGHFKKRGNLLLRLDERNCRPQCPSCNGGKDGNLGVYRSNLEIEKPGLPDVLDAESLEVYSPTRQEIKSIIAKYSPLVSRLKSQKDHIR